MFYDMRINIIKKKAVYGLKHVHLNSIIYSLYKPFSKKIIAQSEDVARKQLQKMLPKQKIHKDSINHIITEQVDLQIVIPCFNVEKYIKQCLESIIEQKTDYSYKVVVIDDGSTDETSKIVDAYAKYNFFEIIHQNNKGFSGARNRGLKSICSKYIMFLDSDDKLVEGAIQSLLDVAYRQNADIVEGGYYQIDDSKIIRSFKHKNENQVESLEKLRGYPWGKIISSKLFQNIEFPEGYWFEDSIMGYLIYPLAKNICTIEAIVYCYRINYEGITYTSSKKYKCIDTYWILEEMLEEQNRLGIKNSQYIYELVLQQIYLNFKRTYLMNKDTKKDIFVLSAELLKNKFNGYKTTRLEYTDLEKALRARDYGAYKCFCTFN